METLTFTHSSLTSLPTELVEPILGELDQHSLTACARTNKAWNALCTPYLWRTVHIRTFDRMERFMAIEAQEAFYRNAAYIRGLTLNFLSVYNLFSQPNDHSANSLHTHPPLCSNLRHLEVYLSKDPRRNSQGHWTGGYMKKLLGPALESIVTGLIRQNPGLTRLKINAKMRPETLLSLLIHDLPNLQDLRCGSDCDLDQWLTKILLNHLPESIRTIDINVVYGNPTKRGPVAKTIRKRLKGREPRQHHALESLSIVTWGFIYVSDEVEHLILLPFLNTCRAEKLEEIHTRSLKWLKHKRVKEVFTKAGFVLKRFSGPHKSSCDDVEIAVYFRRSAHWKSIDLRGLSGARSLTAAAIAANCEQLEFLNLGGSNFLSSEIQSILSRATHLQRFVALDHENAGHESDPIITASDMRYLRWGSRSLVEFACQIELPWPDYEVVRRNNAGVPRQPYDVVVSRTLQWLVYKRLAEQTSLKSLCLGYSHHARFPPRNRDRYQRQCLVMTLESGLCQLAGLRELRILNVGTMDHRIGVAELAWMDKAWPNLQTLVGMFDTCANPLPGVCEWFRDNNRVGWMPECERDRFYRCLGRVTFSSKQYQ